MLGVRREASPRPPGICSKRAAFATPRPHQRAGPVGLEARVWMLRGSQKEHDRLLCDIRNRQEIPWPGTIILHPGSAHGKLRLTVR